MNRISMALLATAAFYVAPAANAAVVAGTTINGFNTFVDTNTGRSWVKLNTFSNKSYDFMAAAVTAAGFQVADQSDVLQLLNPLVMPNGWATSSPIMSGSVHFFGAYGPINTPSWSTQGLINFIYDDGDMYYGLDTDIIPSSLPFGSMNIFAYANAVSAVPETSTWAMMVAGFGMAGAALRRRNKVAVRVTYA